MRPVLLVAVLLAAACDRSKETVKPETKAPPHYKVDPATAGSLRGNVRFEGKPPTPSRISMAAEEACQSLHESPVVEELVKVGKNRELANVFVYIKAGLEGKTFDSPQEPVMLDQRGCMFIPRVLAVRAGQTLTVKNSDSVSHNIHPMPRNNFDWNQQQSPGAPDLRRRFARPEVMIPVKCNVHAWMKSYIGVLDHPYFEVTGASGDFDFGSVPPGQYTLAAWHEVLGELTQQVHLRERGSETAEFVFR